MKTTRQGVLSAAIVIAFADYGARPESPGKTAPAAAPGRFGSRRRPGRMARRFPCGTRFGVTTNRRHSSSTGAWAQIQPTAPEGLQTYAVIFHDLEGAMNRTTADTFHWTLFNIPGTAKGLPEGLASGDLPDGARNGPGIASRNGKTPAYFGPGAGPGAFSSLRI